MSSVSIKIIGADGSAIVSIDARDYDSGIVADILRENNSVLLIPESQLNYGFITEIAGVVAVWGEEGSQWWWRLDINGQMAAQGISQARVSNGDTITFNLTEGFGE